MFEKTIFIYYYSYIYYINISDVFYLVENPEELRPKNAADGESNESIFLLRYDFMPTLLLLESDSIPWLYYVIKTGFQNTDLFPSYVCFRT